MNLKFLEGQVTRSKYLILAGGACLALILSIAITIVVGGRSVTDDQMMQSSSQVLAGQAPPILDEEVKDLTELTILILGYGGAGHEGGMLTDVIQVLHFDLAQKQVTAISIPRDLWAQLPNQKQAKINQTFSLGDKTDPVQSGGQLAKFMATQVTGLEIDYFVAIDFVGFKRLIGEVLSGIEVEVTEPLVDDWYPITGREQDVCGFSAEKVAQLTANYSGFELERKFECRYESLNFQPGKTNMHGEQALQFVRSRHGSSGGDFSRSGRQHQVLKAIFSKIVSADGLKNLPELFKVASYTFATDLELNRVTLLTPLFLATSDFEQQTLVLSTQNALVNSKSSDGQFIVVPEAGINNWQQVHQLVKTALNE